MKKFREILFYTFLFILVVGTGLLAGRHISNLTKPLSDEEKQLIAEKRADEERQKENIRLEKELQKQKDRADYIAALSSFGPIIKIQPIDVRFEDAKALALLDNQETTGLQVGQPVVLYDDENYALPLGGMIQSFNQNEGKRKVVIKLPEGTNTEYLSPHVGVILQETVASQRIPLSAIAQNKNGENFIWLATVNNDGKYVLSQKPININIYDEEFFEATQNDIEAAQLIIINPDKYIRADKEYNLFVSELNAPLHNPTKQALIDYELYRLEQDQLVMTQRAEDCFNGVEEPQQGSITLADGSTENSTLTSCNAGAGTDDVMLRVFQSLTTPQNSGSACGTSACGQ